MSNPGEAVAVLNSYLDVHRGVTFPGIPAEYVALAIGQPGPDGTANPSAMPTGNQLTFNPAADATLTMATLGSFTMTATETISHCVRRSQAAPGGTFYGSHALTTPVPVINGSVVSFTTFTMSCGPKAV